MKKLIALLLCLGLVGCITYADIVRTRNRENLMRLSIGMDKTQVVNIMGIETKKAWTPYKGGRATILINNPYRSEIIQSKDKTFEVLYYLTDDKTGNGIITDDCLLPLVFENGKLVGWGWSFLQDNVQKYELRIR